MKVVLPDNKDDIKLKDYMSLMKLDTESDNYEDEIFSLFTGISLEDVGSVQIKEKKEVLNHVYNALNTEGEFKQTFWIDGIEFGFEPNLDNITGDAYSDLVKYSQDRISFLDRQIAVLYRPIKSKDSYKNYTLKKYNGTEGHIEKIRELPMSIVHGCEGFFLTLLSDCEIATHQYMEEEQARGQML